MIVYDYSQIETLMTCGDIHGDYKRFFNEIKSHVKSNKKIDEEIHPLIKEETESSELNGHFGLELADYVIPSLKYKLKNYENSVIIVAGDCGFGFNKPQYYHDLFHKYNELFAEVNTTVLFVRGNHDDPTYFDGSVINYSHIKAIPDYSVVLTKNLATLCVGGATSVDRFWRKQKEVEINKYKTSTKKKLYWDDEAVVYDEEKLMEILNNGIQINSVITHTAPSFAKPNDKDSALGWFKYDNKLKNDLIKERKCLDDLHDFLLQHEQKLLFWAYGHFHVFNNELIHNEKEKTMYLALKDNYSIFEPIFEYNAHIQQLEMAQLQQEKAKKRRRSTLADFNDSLINELGRMAVTTRTVDYQALREYILDDRNNVVNNQVESVDPIDVVENHDHLPRFIDPADFEWQVEMPSRPF